LPVEKTVLALLSMPNGETPPLARVRAASTSWETPDWPRSPPPPAVSPPPPLLVSLPMAENSVDNVGLLAFWLKALAIGLSTLSCRKSLAI
jgi:hypothetical protein